MTTCWFLSSSTKLAVLSNSLPQKKAQALPSLTSQPHQVLASDLVPYSDVQQVIEHQSSGDTQGCREAGGDVSVRPKIELVDINRASVVMLFMSVR